MSFINRRFSFRRLGSRLYYEFTEAALSSEAEWERLADNVAVEVRRHGAPALSSASPTMRTEAGKALVQDSGVEVAAKTVGAMTMVPVREVAAPSVGVSSVVHTDNRGSTHIASNTNTSNNTNRNVGNTTSTTSTIVFL